MPFGESTVIGSVVGALAAAGVAPIIVVVGREAAEIGAAVAGRAEVVVNPDPRRGMLSSIQTGAAALPEGVRRFFIALGDQPRLQPAQLAQLLAAQERTGKGIAMPTYKGKRGHPILLAGRYRQGVLDLTEEQTLRDLLHAHFDDTIEVACDSDAVTSDIDTQEQYRDELRKLAGA
jgi:molybdenum cofactor cytidylyltransferase